MCSSFAKLPFGASVYFLWEFRNNHIFNESSASKVSILKNVEQVINLMNRGLKEKGRPSARRITLW